MSSDREIAVIAPDPLISAFSVLIDSAPHHRLLASAASLEELRAALDEQTPGVILVYFARQSDTDEEKFACKTIRGIKATWQNVFCVAIIQSAAHLQKAKESGADVALVNGVSAGRLLAAIEGETN